MKPNHELFNLVLCGIGLIIIKHGGRKLVVFHHKLGIIIVKQIKMALRPKYVQGLECFRRLSIFLTLNNNLITKRQINKEYE